MSAVSTTHQTRPPLSTVWIMRLLVALTIVFAMAAGYYRSVLLIYHVRYVKLQTKYQQLEKKLAPQPGSVDGGNKAQPN